MSPESGQQSEQAFERYRARLFGIAYRMLGTVEEAEDVLQEAFLRWHREDRAAVQSAEAWLVAVTTRLAIDRLRRLEVERRNYSGNWLPEPIATGAEFAADRSAELASDLSMAFLVLLERLAPEERAALLLRDVFDNDYGEIGRILERSEAACRQLVHRARERVRRPRARFTVPTETRRQLLERFLDALHADDQATLLAVVADDASWTSDGGGKAASFPRVIRSGERIVRLLRGLERKTAGLVRHTVGELNGEPAILTWVGDQLFSTTSVETDGTRLFAFYRVLNPDKLRHAVGSA